MNAQHLIRAIVRQTTVLIAQLATTGGIRAPLAKLADQVFLDLVNELDAQGVGRKVSADMFGMALRTFMRRIQRLSESQTEHGRTLWEVVYDHIRSERLVTRKRVLEAFRSEDEATLRGVLHDLIESGLVFATGTEPNVVFRPASEEEVSDMARMTDDGFDELLWAVVYREGPLTRETLEQGMATTTSGLDEALSRLVADGRVRKDDAVRPPTYTASELVVAMGSDQGWEAAVYDHFHAMTKTIVSRCRAMHHGRIAGGGESMKNWKQGRAASCIWMMCVLVACGGKSVPSTGSETHFACAADADCALLDENARCVDGYCSFPPGSGGTGGDGTFQGTSEEDVPGRCDNACRVTAACDEFPERCFDACQGANPNCYAQQQEYAACLSDTFDTASCTLGDTCIDQAVAWEACERWCPEPSCFQDDVGCSCVACSRRAQCVPGAGSTQNCECFDDGELVGTCSSDSANACDPYLGCCGAFFIVNQTLGE